MVKIKIQFNNKILTLPVNPEKLSTERSADNESVNIIGLGNIIVKHDEGLKNVSIESFFPSSYSDFYTGVMPKTCVNFINTIWKSEKIARITTEGLPVNINMYFVINNFNYDNNAGEEDDIYYTLDITEYRPYGARLVNMQGTTNNAILENPTRVNTKPLIDQTYIVPFEDSLVAITKRILGNTDRWRELYTINSKVVGSNPDSIPAGTKLLLPESWVVK